jgi:hypothetical protein
VQVDTPGGSGNRFGFIFNVPSTTVITSTSTTTSSTASTKTTVTVTTVSTTGKTSTTSTSGILVPGLDSSSTGYFENQQNFEFDNVAKSSVSVILQGAGSGTIATGKYGSVPYTDVEFDDPVSTGGMGKQAIKFINVQVGGTTSGIATVTVHYTTKELGNIDPVSLILAYYYNDEWHKCSNISNSVQQQVISGDVYVSRLSDTIFCIGGDNAEGNASLQDFGFTSGRTKTEVPWSMITIIGVSLLVICGIFIFIMEKIKRT